MSARDDLNAAVAELMPELRESVDVVATIEEVSFTADGQQVQVRREQDSDLYRVRSWFDPGVVPSHEPISYNEAMSIATSAVRELVSRERMRSIFRELVMPEVTVKQ